jgi:hypothetical protein
MALKKSISLANGYVAEYLRIEELVISRRRRLASAVCLLYKDQETAAAERPMPATPQELGIRLEGALFTRYFSAAAKVEAVAAGLSLEAEAIFYRAIDENPQLTVGDFNVVLGAAGPRIEPFTAGAARA